MSFIDIFISVIIIIIIIIIITDLTFYENQNFCISVLYDFYTFA